MERRLHEMYFLSLPNRFRPRSSTDQRDKVYVPLGLAQDVDDCEIIFDYEKSAFGIFVDVAKCIVSRPGRELDLLGYATRVARAASSLPHTPLQDLPTWVPDWTSRTRLQPFLKAAGISHGQNSQSQHYSRLHNADRGRSAAIEVSGRNLHIHGLCFDTISGTSPAKTDNETITDPRTGTTVSLRGEAADDAFLRTLLAGISDNAAEEPFRSNRVDWGLHVAGPDLLDAEDSNKNMQMTFAASTATFGRWLCSTKHGRIGLVPADAHIGDQIAVFLGGQVPYVMRPVLAEEAICEDHQKPMQTFEFVGECYIDGMMDDEAVKDDEEGNYLRLV